MGFALKIAIYIKTVLVSGKEELTYGTMPNYKQHASKSWWRVGLLHWKTKISSDLLEGKEVKKRELGDCVS